MQETRSASPTVCLRIATPPRCLDAAGQRESGPDYPDRIGPASHRLPTQQSAGPRSSSLVCPREDYITGHLLFLLNRRNRRIEDSLAETQGGRVAGRRVDYKETRRPGMRKPSVPLCLCGWNLFFAGFVPEPALRLCRTGAESHRRNLRIISLRA